MTAGPVAFGHVGPTVSESKIRIRAHTPPVGTRAGQQREIAKKEPSTSAACGARPPCVVRSQREANKDKDHPATKTENCPRKRGRSSHHSFCSDSKAQQRQLQRPVSL